MVEKTTGTATVATNQNTAALNTHGNAIDSLTSKIGRLANIGNLFIAWEAIKQALSAFDGLEKHNIDLLRTTEILGGNATAASTWSVIAEEMGISVDTIDRAFTKLSTDLNSVGNPALKQMGISAEDSRGKLRPLNDIINQSADYFHAHAGAVNNAALANALFGRSGYELLPVLEQGRAGIQAITDEARKYGLILDATAIERNAAFTFQLKEGELAAQGFGLAVGNAALPAVAALLQALSKAVEDNLPAFVAMINRAVSYVVGFVEAFTGMTLEVGKGALALSSLGGITGDTGSAMDKAANNSEALAAAIQKVRDRTTDATRAIDAQIKSLNAQKDAQSFMDSQAKLQQDLANKANDIDKLRQQEYQQFWLGNFATAADIGDQITKAQQDQADLQVQITRGVEDNQTKLQVAALEARKQTIQDAATKQIEAMQRAAKGTTDAMAGAAASMGPLFGTAGKAAADKFKFALDAGAESIGQSMGSKLMDAMFGPLGDIGGEGHHKFVRLGGQGFVAIGNAIGQAIANGITTALGNDLNIWWSNLYGQVVGSLARSASRGGGGLDPNLFKGIKPVGASAAGAIFTKPTLTWVAEGGKDEAVVDASWVRPGNTMPGASALPALSTSTGGAGADMRETNGLLREQNRILRAWLGQSGSGGSTTGALAALNNLLDTAKGNRARGVVGARI